MRRNRLRGIAFAAGLVLCAGLLNLSALAPVSTAVAAEEAPDKLLEEAVETLLEEFTRRRAELEQDQQALFALVERIVVPLFDFPRIAKLVLAKHWRQASAQQREEFITEFKDLLLRTYATALFRYTGNEKLTFTGVTISERKGRKFATVNSELTLGDAPPIGVDYSLLLNEEGEWKIYNLIIEGLNLVSNYRGIYGESVNRQGLDGVLETMRQTSAAQ